jgi:uncharacterized membrane protein
MFSTHQQEHLRFKKIICDLFAFILSIMVVENYYYNNSKHKEYLAKLDDGLAESPTVMVVETKQQQKQKLCKNRG